jgi:hypothetical protein
MEMPTAKRILLASASALMMTAMLAGCATPAPAVVERVVEQTVQKEVTAMEQNVELTEREYDLGLVTYRTDDGAAMDFARDLSEQWEYEGEWYVVLGCRWAAAMADADEPTVIAAVRTRKDELEAWVEMIADKYAHYGVEPMGSTVGQYFKDGQFAAAGWDGGP